MLFENIIASIIANTIFEVFKADAKRSVPKQLPLEEEEMEFIGEVFLDEDDKMYLINESRELYEVSSHPLFLELTLEPYKASKCSLYVVFIGELYQNHSDAYLWIEQVVDGNRYKISYM